MTGIMGAGKTNRHNELILTTKSLKIPKG